MVKWQVASYFVNVGLGDGAIHLLLDKDKTKKYQIIKAVLIDGGIRGQHQMNTATKQIIKFYGTANFKYDAVVLTHWDRDHYEGSMTMFQSSLTLNDYAKCEWIDKDTVFYLAGVHMTAWTDGAPKIYKLSDDKKGLLIKRFDKKPQSTVALCKAVYGHDCLGMDIFSGKHIGRNDKLSKIMQTAIQQDANLLGRPILLCVGVDHLFINGKTMSQVGQTATNASSIMCLLLRHTTSTEVQLYTGGDAEDAQEETLYDWLHESGVKKLNVIKCGHHGSSNATNSFLFDLEPEHFIMSVGEDYGHPSRYLKLAGWTKLTMNMSGTDILHHGLLRRPVRDANRPINTFDEISILVPQNKELNIEKVLNKTLLPFYHSELKRLTEDTSDIVDDYFPLFDQRLKEVYQAMTKPELDKYNYWWRKIHDFKSLKETDLNEKDRRLYRALAAKDQIKSNLWSSLQNDVIELVRDWWPDHGTPIYPVTVTGNSKKPLKPEVYWISVKFFGTSPPKPSTEHYGKTTKVNITTKYFKASDTVVVDKKVKTVAIKDDKLTSNKSLNGKRAAQADMDNKLQKYQDKAQKQKKNKNDGQSFLMRTQIADSLFPMAQAVPIDQLDAWIWESLTQGLPLASIPSPSSKRFDSTTTSAAGLTRFHECLHANAMEITMRNGTTSNASSIERFILWIEVTATKSLKFTSESRVLELQFGHDTAALMNDRGYCDDLQAVILGLEVENTFRLDLSEFLGLIGFDLSAMNPWIRALLANVPIELQPPKAEIASESTDAGNYQRCGIWIQPQFQSRSVLRIEGIVPTTDQNVNAFLSLIKDNLHASDISELRVIGTVCSTLSEVPKRKAKGLTGSSKNNSILYESMLSFAGTLFWQNSGSRVSFAASLSDSSLSLYLQPPRTLTLLDISKWIVEKFGSSVEESDREGLNGGFTDLLGKLAKGIIPRQIGLTLGPQATLQAFEIDVELQLTLSTQNQTHVPIHGQILWVPGRVELLGEIWNLEDDSLVPFGLNPFRETFSEVRPDPEHAVDSIWLPSLFDPSAKPEDFPAYIPLELRDASVKVTLGDWKTLLIQGRLLCTAPPTDTNFMPPIWLDELQVTYLKDFNTKTSSFELRGTLTLQAPPYALTPLDMATATVYIGYYDGWTLAFDTTNLPLANLYNLLPVDGSNHTIMNFMSGILIKELSITARLSKSQPSALDVEGVLYLGPLELDLNYHHDATKWNLSATLKHAPTSGPDPTLGELLGDVLRDYLESLPDFVTNFKVPIQKISATLRCSSEKLKGSEQNHSIFSLTVVVDKFSFTLVQMQDPAKAFPQVTEGDKSKPKRLLRFGLVGLPEAKDVPILQQLPQPFDEMEFLWLSEDITLGEAQLLNQEVFKDNTPPLRWKISSKQDETGSNPASKVLAAGCHFQLIMREQEKSLCALDYVFNAAARQAAAAPTNPATVEKQSDKLEPQQSAGPTGGTVTTPVTRSAKGLNIQNMGLKMKDKKTLTITLDAIISLGPLAFSLIGFEVNINFEKFKTPSDISQLSIDLGLKGMAVAFSKPPATLAGMFAREVTAKTTTYLGGLSIGVGPWQFLAAGVYEEHEDYKTVFVFAKLNGPLISFGFAEVNGIVGGFGYNSKLRFPSIEEVTKFPFVSINTGAEDPADNVIQQFAALTNTKGPDAWFTSQRDSLWLAAGLGVKAFQLLDVQAVLCIDLSTEPKIGIFAQAVATLPKGAAEDKSFLYLDLGIAAVYDPGAGILSVRGELSPRSFVLSKSCRLTGGFALVYFLPASGHDGDWVFTVGGYHPHFRPPAHYPQNVSRVGISWSYDDEVNISGEAYFAITPQAVMGGGRLDVKYASGRVRASFSAWANFLIYYEPFSFQAEVGVNVFASARIGWGILSKDVSGELYAMVELHGPPVAGVAHVSFWFISITIRFGPSHIENPPLDWSQFYILAKQCSKLEDAKALPEHLLTLLRGRLNTDTQQQIPPTKKVEKSVPDLWLVRAPLFEFEVVARFPIREVRYNNLPSDERIKARTRDIFSLPMKQRNAFSRSELVITIQDKTQKVDGNFILEPILKRVPGALWNQYDPNKSLLDLDSTIEHVVGVKFKPQAPIESKENLPPLEIKKFNHVSIGNKDTRFPAAEYAREMKIRLPKSKSEVGDKTSSENRISALKIWDEFRSNVTGGGPLYPS